MPYLKKRGRPELPLDEKMTPFNLLISPTMLIELRAVAKMRSCYPSEIIREALEEHLAFYRQESE